MRKNVIEKYYGNDRATKVIYGAILIFAFLVGQGHSSHYSALPIVFGTFFAAVAIVLAEVYADILGKTIRHKRKLTKAERIEVERDSLAIISVSFWPSVIFALSYAGLFSISTAFTFSYLLLLSVLFAFSYWAGRLSGNTKAKALLFAAATSIIGLLVVTAKYALGH